MINTRIQTVYELFTCQTPGYQRCMNYLPAKPFTCCPATGVIFPATAAAALSICLDMKPLIYGEPTSKTSVCATHLRIAGGVDYFTNSVALDCARRGGYLIDWKCTCDISPGMCKGDTTIPIPSDTITPLASHNNSTSDGESEGQG